MSSVRHQSESSSRLLAMLATTTWVCSCGSGVGVLADGARPGVLDHDRQQAVRLVPERALGADAHAHRLGLEQPQRRLDARAVRGQQFASGLGVAEGECEADALGRAEGEVPAAHALLLDLALDDLRRLPGRTRGASRTRRWSAGAADHR